MNNEIKISKKNLDLFREIIHEKSGIYFSKKKDYLLENKINKILKKSGYQNIDQLINNIFSNDNGFFENFIRYITTTHTFFFRESDHLIFLSEHIKKTKKHNQLIYIWCAASSTGEEVYSIIIELLENDIKNFSILASDINKDVLFHLKKGIYDKQRLKFIKPFTLNKYFLPEDKQSDLYKVKKSLKNYFIVKKLNLVNKIRFEIKFDYIFCRNVMIYFNKDTQTKVVENLFNNLKQDGLLFVGHSETLLNMADRLRSVYSSVYTRK